MASPYVQPVPSSRKGRQDKGQDYQGIPGHNVVAIGRARVDYVKKDPGGFGLVVYYTLLDGPSRGQQIYVGHAQPVVRRGDVVEAGQPVARLLQKPLGNAHTPGWTEVGLARDGVPAFPSPVGGERLAALLHGAPTSSTPAAAVPASASGPSSTPVSSAAAVPNPYSTPPPVGGARVGPAGLLPPGSVQADGITPRVIAETWRLIASDPLAPPETQSYLANAALAAGG